MLIQVILTEKDVAAYLLSKSSHLKVKHSQLENCTLNCNVIGNHQMRQCYKSCRCSNDSVCPLLFKVNFCQKSSHIEVYEENDKRVDCISKGIENIDTTKPTRGVATIVKNMIENMCREDPDDTPKRILSRLIQIRKQKNSFDKQLIPSLVQVCILISIFD